jgi:hypothetical protein
MASDGFIPDIVIDGGERARELWRKPRVELEAMTRPWLAYPPAHRLSKAELVREILDRERGR